MADCFEYRKTYIKGAFRGVSFEMDSAGSEHGKRAVMHEFPFRDTPFTEELGRKGRRFHIDGFFVSDDHVDRKHRMRIAVEQAGAGTLAHPTYGTVQVICESISFTDSRTKGRRTDFSADFLEAGSWLFPGISTDNRGLLSGTIVDAITTVVAAFNQNYLASARTLTSSALSNTIEDFGLRLEDSVTYNGDASIANYPLALDAARDFQAIPLVKALDGQNVADAIYNYSQAVTDARKFLKSIVEYSSYPTAEFLVPGSGVISSVERQSGKAFIRLVKSIAGIEAARATIDIDLLTRVDAEERLETAVFMLDDAIELASGDFDDDSRGALEEVRNEVVKDIYLQISQLPVLITNNFRRRLPSLVIADRLYSDANRRQEVRDGNPVQHPLWEPNCITSALI